MTDTTCFALAGGRLVGDATDHYRRLDDSVGICIDHPNIWQGGTVVVLNAIFGFAEMTDRAVILYRDEPPSVADGKIRVMPTMIKPNA